MTDATPDKPAEDQPGENKPADEKSDAGTPEEKPADGASAAEASDATAAEGKADDKPAEKADDGHGHGHDDHGHHGPSYVEHHFDDHDQQVESGKFGMWLFLATEVLLFSGLFCAYAVLRHLHPEIFHYGHFFLDKNLGALNTVILLTSSLTMAWAVRAAMLGKTKVLVMNLALTLLFGAGFFAVKFIEYSHKIDAGLLWGDTFRPNDHAFGHHGDDGHGDHAESEDVAHGDAGHDHAGHDDHAATISVQFHELRVHGNIATFTLELTGQKAHEYKLQIQRVIDGTDAAPVAGLPTSITTDDKGNGSIDARVDLDAIGVGKDATHSLVFRADIEKYGPRDSGQLVLDRHRLPADATITAVATPASPPMGLASAAAPVRREFAGPPQAHAVDPTHEPANVHLFFGLYFVMTGLHGLHVLVGMIVIAWLLVRSIKGSFSTGYYDPVDIGGLYWHLVDLIWIFLFPLLYLID